MGRRKTKTAKKQQAATKKLSKAFAKKLGVSTTHRGKEATVPMIVSNNTASVASAGGSSNHSKAKSKKASPMKRTWTKKAAGKKQPPKKAASKQEQAEFAQEQEQLHERESIVEWKRNPKTAPVTIAFQPATFETTKSVNQMIEETVRQVEGLKGIGGAGTSGVAGMMGALGGISLQQYPTESAWPGAATAMTEESMLSENPWAVLNDGSDNELHSLASDMYLQRKPAPPPLASIAVPVTNGFQPATFTFQSSNNSISTADIDPDL